MCFYIGLNIRFSYLNSYNGCTPVKKLHPFFYFNYFTFFNFYLRIDTIYKYNFYYKIRTMQAFQIIIQIITKTIMLERIATLMYNDFVNRGRWKIGAILSS